jgi:predicted O-methyltransferase YrrM
MNGDHEIPAFFKAIIEECALRATEEDIEGIPEWERFRVLSSEAGLLIYIFARAARRLRLAELGGAGGSASTIAWLAGAASAVGGEVTGWETNPRRMLKLQNCLCRSRLSPNVNLSSVDPLWELKEGSVIAPSIADFAVDSEGAIIRRFDCVVLSLIERDWLRRLNLGWELLESGGLLILTDTLHIDDEAKATLSEFLESRTAAVVGIKTGEGIALAYKIEREAGEEFETGDAELVGPQAAMVLDDLATMNRRPGSRLWAIPPETGRFLWILARSMDAQKVLEIGASGGYSGTWLASALESTGGRLTTMDADKEKVELARESFAKAGVSDRIELIQGDAFDILPGLKGTFDMVFLDAEKDEYLDLLDYILPLLREDGLLIADNVYSHVDELKLYVDTVQHHSGLASVTAGIGSGEEVTLKLG